MSKQIKRGAFRFDKEFVDDLVILESIASGKSNINFNAKNGVMTVSLFGEEVQARKHFGIANNADFDFSAKAAEITSPMKNFGEGIITVYENHIRLNSGGTNMARQISTDLPVCEFPDFGERDFQELPNDIFTMASFASFAVSKSNSGKSQERTSVKLKDGAVSIYALDGFRGVMIDGSSTYRGDDAEYLFTPDLVDGLAKLIRKNSEARVFVANTGSKYLLKVGGIEVTTRVLACSDSFRQVVDGVMKSLVGIPVMKISLPTAEMVCYLDRTKLVVNGSERHKLELFFDPIKHTVKAEFRAGVGELVELFETEYGENAFDNFSIALNPGYLLETCSRLHSTSFTAEFCSSERPMLIREQYNDYRIVHMVLPVAQKRKPENAEETVADFTETREAVLVSELIDATPTISKFVTPSGEETDFTEEDLK